MITVPVIIAFFSGCISVVILYHVIDSFAWKPKQRLSDIIDQNHWPPPPPKSIRIDPKHLGFELKEEMKDGQIISSQFNGKEFRDVVNESIKSDPSSESHIH